MHFQTVFDISQAGYTGWRFPAYGLAFVAIGLLLLNRDFVSGFASGNDLSETGIRRFAWCFFLFGLFWTLIAFGATYGQYHYARSAFDSGHDFVVEGPVTDFKPMPYGGHQDESFSVAGKHFSYSDYEVSAGFNNSRSHGGPIRSGLYVRITYIGNLILRLEIAH